MVNSHAFRLVPGEKLPRACQALTSVSCARSSAASGLPHKRSGKRAQERDQLQQIALENRIRRRPLARGAWSVMWFVVRHGCAVSVLAFRRSALEVQGSRRAPAPAPRRRTCGAVRGRARAGAPGSPGSSPGRICRLFVTMSQPRRCDAVATGFLSRLRFTKNYEGLAPALL